VRAPPTRRIVRALGWAFAAAALLVAPDAGAVDLPSIGGSPTKLDITETSIVSQRFVAREGELPADQGYFAWLNRLNLVFSWRKLTVGARIDSSMYALRPEDRDFDDPQLARNAVVDGSTRYRDAIYPAKLWIQYKTRGLEATLGDSYVQFGRGLVLSVRKVDELGIDTTLLGGKVVVQEDPFSLTLVAGQANPARVDEPTGRALFLPKPVPGEILGPQPLFGSDRIIGAQLQAGRGLPIISSTHAARLTKCAPYRYNEDGSVNASFTSTPIGTCDEEDSGTFLARLPQLGPVLRSPETINAGQSFEVPDLWGHGNFYVEAAVQRRQTEIVTDPHNQGNALYGALVTNTGPATNTIEFKSYRNFFPLAGGVNVSRAAAFGNIAYSAPPTTEVIIQDSMFGFFNACVTGARDRLDWRFGEQLVAYATFGQFVTRSEVPGGQCDHLGRSTAADKDGTTNYVTDASLGLQYIWDDDKSIAFLNVTGRNDVTARGDPYYREVSAQYSVTKFLVGMYSLEFAGRHRYRVQEQENLRSDSLDGEPWWQGEHQNALKIAPKWVLSQGFEYTTFVGLPTYYINGGVFYRLSNQSNIRAYIGQNRGGLRCVSGICRVFPSFSGGRVELTLRF
jgi:hypothetical protein